MIEGLSVQTSRLATLTSVLRTRKEDSQRKENHDGAMKELNERSLSVVERLEKIADRLEKNL